MHRHDRRTFLKRAGAAAAGAGLAGIVPGAASESPASESLHIAVEPENDPLAARAASILKNRILRRCPDAGAEAKIVLAVDAGLTPDAFRIEERDGALRIAAGSSRGLLYGAGKFLRTSRFDGGFTPSSWRGVSEPRGSLRGMYFATHFHNWYCQASPAEIAEYLEDMALWGANALMVIFPMINLQGWDDPEAEPALAMMRKYAATAKELGVLVTTGLNNTLFIGAPADIRATRLPDPLGRRGNSGHPICPSTPAGHAYIMDNTRRLLERLQDIGLDIAMFWPYDEGGCACAQCAPWGSNGYFKLSRDLAALGRSYFPALKTVLSTWMFDTPPEGEWQGLADELGRGNDWLDYILADAHEDFPRYPLEHSVPGNLPLLNFPEISMWGNSPWGGCGAHPLPARFQRLWDQVKHVVRGGFPYSEGIYEDMNKAVELQFYWNPGQSAQATLAEYIAYEYGAPSVGDVLELVHLLEAAATNAAQKKDVDVAEVRRAYELALAVETQLPEWGRKNWRWEILRIRALLDRERFGGNGLESPEAEAAMTRLVEIYHAQMETDDPYHHRVRPPLRGAVSRHGEC